MKHKINHPCTELQAKCTVSRFFLSHFCVHVDNRTFRNLRLCYKCSEALKVPYCPYFTSPMFCSNNMCLFCLLHVSEGLTVSSKKQTVMSQRTIMPPAKCMCVNMLFSGHLENFWITIVFRLLQWGPGYKIKI